MAENYLITGYHGAPHVTAENDRGINAAIFGAGRYVLDVGEKFRAEYIGNNTIRMYDGKLCDNGAAAGIPAGEYVDLVISNASQLMKRNDLIVFQYSQDASTLIESGAFVVLQGIETSGTPADPVLSQSDLLSGTASFDQMALWRVSVSGATISAPVQLYELANTNSEALEALAEIEGDITALETKVNANTTNISSISSQYNTLSQTVNNTAAKLPTNIAWTNLTVGSTYFSSVEQPKYSVYGKIVSVKGVVKAKSDIGYLLQPVLASGIPSAYRPSSLEVKLCATNAATYGTFLCQVTTAGEIKSMGFKPYASGEIDDIPANTELRFNLTYRI